MLIDIITYGITEMIFKRITTLVNTVRFGCLFIIACLVGCKSTFDLGIEISSIELIKREALVSVIGSGVELPLYDYWAEGDFIIVTLDSNTDFAEIGSRYKFSFSAKGWLCEDPNEHILFLAPDIYYNGQEVLGYVIHGLPLKPNNQRRYRYQLVIFSRWTKEWKIIEPLRNSSQIYYMKFNLIDDPKDLCFKIRGASIVGLRWESETVVISKDAIKSAIEANRRIQPPGQP